MSLLTIAQSVAVRIGVARPTIAASSADLQVQQIVEFINEEGQELAARHSWQALRYEANFTTAGAEDQGSILVIAGADFRSIVNETIWNRSQRRPIFGPKSPAEWQQLKAQFSQGPWYQYIIRNNHILFTPAAAAGQNCYFEWMSNNWAQAGGGGGKSQMNDDGDLSLLDERLIRLGAIWRFQAAKGLESDVSFAKYDAAVNDAIARDGGAAILNLRGAADSFAPGVVVPAGNWGL